MPLIKLLFLGDIVGSSGRRVVEQWVPRLRQEMQLDFVVANGENAAAGFGLTPQTTSEILKSGVDCITGGNHTFDKKEISQIFNEWPGRVLRPANYPPGTAGSGVTILKTAQGQNIGIINLMGRVFMEQIDCPFQVLDKNLETVRQQTPVILIDMHAEATSEKQAIGFYADGRVSAVVGTHSHVPTADERILPGGTGFVTDCGMNGDYDSVIGMKKEIILQRFTRKQHIRMEVSEGPGMLWGIVFGIDPDSGKCFQVERIKRNAL